MFIEGRQPHGLDVFMVRADQLAYHGRKQADQIFLMWPEPKYFPYGYQQYQVIIDGKRYGLAVETVPGDFDSTAPRFFPRHSWEVSFAPLDEDNLRLIKGGAQNLPTFTVTKHEGTHIAQIGGGIKL